MTCSPADLRDYFFDALAPEERAAVRRHLAACAICTTELDALSLTAVTLRALPEEELPRRIAFVSDKVFEPSPLLRFWRSFWLSGARLGAAAVALLAVAIFVHAFRTPAPANAVPSHIGTPVVTASSNAEIDSRILTAVTQAVAQSEARFNVRLDRLAAENEKQKRTIDRAAEAMEFMDRRSRVMTVASNRVFDPEPAPTAAP